MLQGRHKVASSTADAIQQWFNAGGMIQFYDYSLETYLNVSISSHVSMCSFKLTVPDYY